MIPAIGRALETTRSFLIRHPDTDADYLRRYVLWGATGLDPQSLDDGKALGSHAGYVHRIYREDADRHLHDHPWQWGAAVILSGGYEEQRAEGDRLVLRSYRVGDLNILKPGDFHRITMVLENTWTLFLCGRVTNDWGFLVNGQKVLNKEYLAKDSPWRK